MPVTDGDPYIGHMTAGHYCNGINALNRPVLRMYCLFLSATVLFAVVWWMLMPAWPLGVTYTRGLLDVDQRTTVAHRLAEGAARRAEWVNRIEAADIDAVQADTDLLCLVRQSGQKPFTSALSHVAKERVRTVRTQRLHP